MHSKLFCPPSNSNSQKRVTSDVRLTAWKDVAPPQLRSMPWRRAACNTSMNTCCNRKKKGNFVVVWIAYVCVLLQRTSVCMHACAWNCLSLSAQALWQQIFTLQRCTLAANAQFFHRYCCLRPCWWRCCCCWCCWCCVGKVKLQFIAINYKPSTTSAVTKRRCNTYTHIQSHMDLYFCVHACVCVPVCAGEATGCLETAGHLVLNANCRLCGLIRTHRKKFIHFRTNTATRAGLCGGILVCSWLRASVRCK